LLGEYAKTADVSPPHGGIDDPHYWLDTFYARLYAAHIAEQLVALDPQGRGVYAQNLATLRSHIGDVEAYLQQAVTQIPPEHRALVTTHDAFRHMAIPLGLEVIGAVSHAPGQEEGPQQIAELIDAVKERGLPAVFKEPQISEESQTLDRIAAEQGVLVCTLYSDSLDEAVPTYIDMMRFNADELARCLGAADGS
jgi:ABC-type Zn uptake system ZnuABC Zn-binding protein ZnuA